MQLYNVYIRQESSGIVVKVGDKARAREDKHKSTKDNFVGYLSSSSRAEAVRTVSLAVGTALAQNGRIMKPKS